MTEGPFFPDDRRFPEALDRARAALSARLREAGDDREPTPAEEAVLAAAALLADDVHARVNQLEERLRAPLLALLGLRPAAARAARTHVRLWFEPPPRSPVDIPAGTLITTAGGGPVFSTVAPAAASPATLRDTRLAEDVLLIGLGEPAGATVLRLDGDHLDATGEWDCWAGTRWLACRVRDRQPGAVLIEVPPRHATGEAGAAWLRARRDRNRPVAPRVSAAVTVAVTVPVVNARRIEDEPLGVGDGTPGLSFPLRERPVLVDGAAPVVEVGDGSVWTSWPVVPDFSGGTAQSRRVVVDHAAGQVRFPPAIRRPDGSIEAHGAVPGAGQVIRIRGYWTGGGSGGNVAQGELTVLRTPLPEYPGRVRAENPYPAQGGCDTETAGQLWARAPFALRAGDRAVTAADHEVLARQAHAGIARVRCVDTAEAVRVLIVPRSSGGPDARPQLDDLRPPAAMLAAVRDHLEPRRLLGVRLSVEPPSYQGISVTAQIVTDGDEERVRAAVTAAVDRLLDPVSGGADGQGWEFGRPVTASGVRKLLFGIDGVLDVEHVALSPVDPVTGARSPAQQTIALIPAALPLPGGHDIEVLRRD
ncbi:putative baseplate assembly protein [Actinoplanes sp. N902-109]|uniref:putative baseplate assembly protein n=1 Tax=Actinoplanes sp. (strain N902-109) TaxID=649831 RepID=UPI0003295A2C|nr:putative baseplate assembly protein [Actinoplanes sp. N902-109]AGL18923.1 hypothetical protein L083_5413 [Actinoplanes sp. N902-109]